MKTARTIRPTTTQTVILRARRCVLLAVLVSAAALTHAAGASAGTYPMYQCSPGHPAVAPGWSVSEAETGSSTVLSNTCAVNGAIGLYVYANGTPGEFMTSGLGGTVAVNVNVNGAPDVTIAAISAHVSVSPNTGDDAWLGFDSSGALLPGMVELPFASTSPYSTNESWTLPSDATSFTAFINCSTDRSQTACQFSNASEVPALNDITLTLIDNTPPTLSNITGSLATAAARNQTVGGNQTLGFTARDADSGVLSATLTLTPQGSSTPYTKTVSWAAQCTYESWNACPLTQSVTPLDIPTATLKDDSYTVSLSTTDAAGNVTQETLGTITTDNAPTNTSPPDIVGPEEPEIGSTLSVQPGTWTTPAEAGQTSYTYQWQRCNAQGENCQPIPDAQNPIYLTTQADAGHTLRVAVTASDNDGSTTATSGPTPTLPTPQQQTTQQSPGTPTNTNAATTPPSNNNTEPQPTTGLVVTPAPPATSQTPGAPNGTPASESAVIHLTTPQTLTRPYARRAITITGRLLNATEKPIANATLDVLERVTTGAETHLITHGHTASNGSFSIRIPRGPSRQIQIAYRAFANNPKYTSLATVTENVSAGVQLTITPHHAEAKGGVITLQGTVNGPVPQQGALVELLVHYRGRWVPFRTPQTKPNGHFKTKYEFQGAVGHFAFRAVVPAGQAELPYTNGTSKTITITT